MIKFLKKYKYVSLVAGALSIALVSGSVFFVCNYKIVSNDEVEKIQSAFSKLFEKRSCNPNIATSKGMPADWLVAKQCPSQKTHSVKDLKRQIESIPRASTYGLEPCVENDTRFPALTVISPDNTVAYSKRDQELFCYLDRSNALATIIRKSNHG